MQHGDLSADAFATSAAEFGRSALIAHAQGNPRRVALDAGTALEHLAKAALSRRSPALLAEMRGPDSWRSLIYLLGIPTSPRTISLSVALDRMEAFTKRRVSSDDLKRIVDRRDGAVHTARAEDFDDHLLGVFARHAETLLADIGKDRQEFWDDQLEVVDALLTEVTDSVRHRVEVKMASARATYIRVYGDLPAEAADLARADRQTSRVGDVTLCPACSSWGLATGEHTVDWEPSSDEDGLLDWEGTVKFTASGFECPICRLRLDSVDEMEAAGVEVRWTLDGVDPLDYDDYPTYDYEGDAYDAYKDSQLD
jgi:hypothetical protein